MDGSRGGGPRFMRNVTAASKPRGLCRHSAAPHSTGRQRQRSPGGRWASALPGGGCVGRPEPLQRLSPSPPRRLQRHSGGRGTEGGGQQLRRSGERRRPGRARELRLCAGAAPGAPKLRSMALRCSSRWRSLASNCRDAVTGAGRRSELRPPVPPSSAAASAALTSSLWTRPPTPPFTAAARRVTCGRCTRREAGEPAEGDATEADTPAAALCAAYTASLVKPGVGSTTGRGLRGRADGHRSGPAAQWGRASTSSVT